MEIYNDVFLYKVVPLVVRVVPIMLSFLAGYLIYSGLASRIEKQQLRIRFKVAVDGRNEKHKEKVNNSKSEKLFKEAGYPLGINGIKWELIKNGLWALAILNYVFFPIITTGDFSIIVLILVMIGMIMLLPTFRFSLTRFILNRLIDYKKAKRNAELFSLYDMLISEIQMMQNTRINSYSIIRTLKPYLKEIDGPLSRLLAGWTSDVGPEKALDAFAKEIDTNEAKSLANVLKKFDENKKETILQSLKGMEDMFITSQIENYRRRRKLYVDIANLPIKAAHGLIILNFVVVVVFMVSNIMKGAHL